MCQRYSLNPNRGEKPVATKKNNSKASIYSIDPKPYLQLGLNTEQWNRYHTNIISGNFLERLYLKGNKRKAVQNLKYDQYLQIKPKPK